jgi:signal transduction histidine kinase/CheY-like chemotaxis protein
MLPSVVAEVLASLPYGVMIIDNVGNIQYLNQMALVLLDDGLQQDTNVSILEQPWVNQLELVSKLSALISHGRAFEAKRIHPPSGSNTIGAMSARGFPLQRYAVSVLLISDASREMESQRLALVASELQVFNDVVGRLAHEFNNALLGVRGHADRLMERMERDDAGYQLAGQLHHASQQMIAVVDGLLMLVRGDSAGSEASVDCNAVAATAIKISRQELPQNIELHLHTTGDIPHVSIGRAHLEYVLLNLIRQARDNIQHENVHRGGRIDVNLQQTDAGIHIEIANDGPVQPIVITEALFDPLHGLGEPNHGRGLGLPVSRGIVHAVGGELNFRSSIDSGTVVELRLPPLCAVPSLSPKGVIPKAPASVSILVVEDNDIVRELCVDVLQQEGYATQVAITGADAVRIASHSSIDLAIVDLGLPDMDGLEAAAALGVPVILVSGNPPALFNRVGELRDEWRFLKKPFGIPELLNCVGELLEKVSLGDLVGELGEHSH